MAEEKIKFTVVGIVTSTEFQKCKFYVEKLCRSFPKVYEKPNVRPMLNVEWKEYLWKIRRKIGGKVWTLEKNAVVLMNNEFLGDDEAIFKYAVQRARIIVRVNFHCLGIIQLKEMFVKAMEYGRKFAYFTIAVEGKSIGSMLFMLYADYCPKTVKHFLRRCKSEKRGWLKRPIHRIAKGSWLQLGGHDLAHRHMACENYIVPHDRRGVLSTCNEDKHTNNSTQLILSLATTPWMDYKFVAFGQLIQGDEVLKRIEAIATNYESPKKAITVMRCGEYTLDTSPDPNAVKEVKCFLDQVNPYTDMPDDVIDPRDVSSELSVGHYKKGYYCHELDLMNHPALNMWHLIDFDMSKYDHDLGEWDNFQYDYDQNGVKFYTNDSKHLTDDEDIEKREVEQRVHQLLSEDAITFSAQQQNTKAMQFEKIQKIDPQSTPPAVLQDIMDILSEINVDHPKSISSGYKHIIE